MRGNSPPAYPFEATLIIELGAGAVIHYCG
jgi:hypothetical protein